MRSRAVCLIAVAVLFVACDDDPSRPDLPELQADLSAVPDSLEPQGAIRVSFNRPLVGASAQDPANFVVTDTCTGLRVPGSLRLEDESTIVFSPSRALPFLSVLAVRVQNILDQDGGQLAQPVTFARTVLGPPVGDVSWDLLSSPTSEELTGISFVDDDIGYLLARNGTLYFTQDGGGTYGAIYKDITITDTYNVRALSADSLYMLGSKTISGTPVGGLLRSSDGGLTFTFIGGNARSRYSSFSLRRAGAGVVGLAVGLGSAPEARRYTSAGDAFTASSGLPGLLTPNFLVRIPLGVDLSPDTARAIIAVSLFDPAQPNLPTRGGEAYRSTDGGRNYTPLALPANTPALQGANFINSTEALLVGDSSAVLRVNVATGSVVQSYGAANGIPQTFRDTLTNSVTRFRFSRSEFALDGQAGWIVGRVVTTLPNAPDLVRGVILQTTDGGQSWTRQAVQGVPENGLNFSPVADIHVLRPDFAAVAGSAGFVAARRGAAGVRAAACAFSNP